MRVQGKTPHPTPFGVGYGTLCGCRGQQSCPGVLTPQPRKSGLFTALFSYADTPNPAALFSAKKHRGKAFALLRCGAPGGTRTPDLLVRSQTLYPAELLAHSALLILASFFLFVNAFLNFFGFFQQNAIRVIGEQLHRLSHRHKPGDLHLFRLGAGL